MTAAELILESNGNSKNRKAQTDASEHSDQYLSSYKMTQNIYLETSINFKIIHTK